MARACVLATLGDDPHTQGLFRVARMAQKLGFSGYPEFQASLRAELEQMISGPVAKREGWGRGLPDEHILSRYADAVTRNLRGTLDQLDPAEFDRVAALISDPARRIFIAGGRLTGALARYLYLHLQMIRGDVALIPPEASWPHHMLEIRPGDVLLVFDIRRYENTTLTMGEMAHDREAEIVLFTDQWRSPIQRLADVTFAARIAAPSAWDSSMSLLFLTETLIAAAQEALWESVKARTDELEAAFDRTKLFRKFT